MLESGEGDCKEGHEERGEGRRNRPDKIRVREDEKAVYSGIAKVEGTFGLS